MIRFHRAEIVGLQEAFKIQPWDGMPHFPALLRGRACWIGGQRESSISLRDVTQKYRLLFLGDVS
jgi:hypothetical protein